VAATFVTTYIGCELTCKRKKEKKKKRKRSGGNYSKSSKFKERKKNYFIRKD